MYKLSYFKWCLSWWTKISRCDALCRKSDPEDKTNYWPINVVPSLSKVYEKILYKQLNPFLETKLSHHLCGFHSKYSAQHALSNLLLNWQDCLDKSGVLGTILMDLSKAFNCLPQDLIIAKLHAYGLYHDSLRLIRSYLSNGYQRIKLDSVFSSWM